jgi:hypothetical protein
MNRQTARDIVLAELDRCEASINRARSIAGVLSSRFQGLDDEFEDMLERVVGMRSRLRAA